MSALRAGQQLRLDRHVPGDTHDEQFERRGTAVGESARLTDANRDRVPRANRGRSRFSPLTLIVPSPPST
jgi:hypothetical protein